jgi:ABC-type nitrate/sulfonate/bicarbonate transport system ATPase subunit
VAPGINNHDLSRSSSVGVQHVSKAYNDLAALDEVSLSIDDGQFVSLVGPSGCGKSTLFNIIAGLLRPDEGRITFGNLDVTGQTGHVGYMLQQDLLLPWRTVLDNVVLGLDVQGLPRSESHARARELLVRFGLGQYAMSYPAALSGGMRQRCAMIRTILFDAPVLLLDEPFSALDAQTRLLMQEWLLEVWEGLQKTVFYITHDIDEALFLSDRVYVMSSRPGRLIDVVEVGFGRPRTHEVRSDLAFARLKESLVDVIRVEAEKAITSADKPPPVSP